MKDLEKMSEDEIENLMKEKVESFEKKYEEYSNIMSEPHIASTELENSLYNIVDDIDEIIMHCVFSGINFDRSLGARYQKVLKSFLAFVNDGGNYEQ